MGDVNIIEGMKTLFKILLWLVIIGTFSFSAYVYIVGPCYAPKAYSVGTYDKRFGVSEAEFMTAVKSAEKIWEDAVGRDLFVYKESGGMSVNLIYDERQATAIRNKNLESKVDATEDSAKAVKAQFENLKMRYETANSSYESMVEDYKKLQDQYSENVSYWNGRGGAPKSEYDKLEGQKQILKEMQAAIEVKRQEVNSLATEVNSLVSKYNYLVKEANSTIDKLNETADQEFEQGEYISLGTREKINIYEFYTKTELTRILVHELGHALGAEHNSNPQSILYYLNKGTGLTLTKEDIAAIKEVCRIN